MESSTQILTELTIQAAKHTEHVSHVRSLLEEVRSSMRWAILLIVGTVLSSILALVLRENGGSAHGTGSGSASAASPPSTSTTSSGQ